MRRTSRVFQVNHAPGAEPIRVNLRTTVNNADIRTVNEDGREYLVIPSYTLPDNVVMNGGLYPKSEIDASYLSLEDTPAPVGHPMAGGKYISAFHPKATNAYYAGAYNRNVRREGNRVYLEKWVDTEFAKNSIRGRELLDAVAAKHPIHTSTGIMLEREPATNGDGYDWIARNMKFDHDAILINETGAATPEQGVGLMVNVADAKPVTVNDDVLSDDSYEAKRDALSQALQDKYGTGDNWVYAEDFDGVNVVYCVEGDYFSTGYSYIDGKVTLSEQSAPVERKVEFSLKATVNKILTMFRSGVTSKTVNTLNTEALDMTPEELKAALDAQLVALNAANTAALAPLTEQITALQAANAKLESALTANTNAQETEMRGVVTEHLGEVVANALSGDALKAAFVKFVPAAPVIGGMPVVNAKDGFADTLPE